MVSGSDGCGREGGRRVRALIKWAWRYPSDDGPRALKFDAYMKTKLRREDESLRRKSRVAGITMGAEDTSCLSVSSILQGVSQTAREYQSKRSLALVPDVRCVDVRMLTHSDMDNLGARSTQPHQHQKITIVIMRGSLTYRYAPAYNDTGLPRLKTPLICAEIDLISIQRSPHRAQEYVNLEPGFNPQDLDLRRAENKLLHPMIDDLHP